MKCFVLTLVVVVVLGLFAPMVEGTVTPNQPANTLAKKCNTPGGALHLACLSYIQGWAQGIEGAMGANDKGVLGTYTFLGEPTCEQIKEVFLRYLSKHPEEAKARAGDVLYHAVTQAGLLTVVTAQK